MTAPRAAAQGSCRGSFDSGSAIAWLDGLIAAVRRARGSGGVIKRGARSSAIALLDDLQVSRVASATSASPGSPGPGAVAQFAQVRKMPASKDRQRTT
eukprot:SAG31_NODE_415_length_15951_cov_13.530848_11_plen_98_part_00